MGHELLNSIQKCLIDTTSTDLRESAASLVPYTCCTDFLPATAVNHALDEEIHYYEATRRLVDFLVT